MLNGVKKKILIELSGTRDLFRNKFPRGVVGRTGFHNYLNNHTLRENFILPIENIFYLILDKESFIVNLPARNF
jgi:hypothetical protein